MAVEILWELFYPANEHGVRECVSRSAKRLTYYTVWPDGRVSQRNTYPRGATLCEIEADFDYWAHKYWKRVLEDRAWWQRLKKFRAEQEGPANIIWVDFTQTESEAA